ncbi:hypothetical protein KC19_10G170500 [Ceratodon purpureus]|uniref:Uncharacterized protein n=1 Tax=Ceratodon purpureus TaxID=3225 RepID=A0A8T0GL83_CERPU|nr:hypothetical protein KC19_10G170500 [Ceratodon purpureus]
MVSQGCVIFFGMVVVLQQTYDVRQRDQVQGSLPLLQGTTFHSCTFLPLHFNFTC